jgi:serine/threonine protein kinase
MEFAEHGDTRKAMKSMKKAGRHFHEAVVKLWLHQMLQGLAYVHSKNVIHRDLKTANVFLTNQWRRSLIGDFGEALVSETLAAFANDCVGTPYYMAPEVLTRQSYTAAIDVWALGAICYELLALRRPFECKSSAQDISYRLNALAFQIANEDPAMEPLHQAGYSEMLCDSVKQMLSKDPAERLEPARLLNDKTLWSNFDMADSEWHAMEAFARSGQASGVDHERIVKHDKATCMRDISTSDSAQLPQVKEAILDSGRNPAPSVSLSGCSSHSITLGSSNPTTASGCSSPSTASGPSSPSNASGSFSWASLVMEKMCYRRSRSATVQALLL